MFTIPTKLRVVIALGATGAALAGSSVASAMTIQGVHTTRPAPVVVKAAPAVANDPAYIDPGKVGSAGIDGYDNAACESLANDYNTATSDGDQDVASGDNDGASTNYNIAHNILNQLNSNCLVID